MLHVAIAKPAKLSRGCSFGTESGGSSGRARSGQYVEEEFLLQCPRVAVLQVSWNGLYPPLSLTNRLERKEKTAGHQDRGLPNGMEEAPFNRRLA